MAKAISMAGTVVGIMFLMCENRSTPVTAGARFVVSESGDTLSPKNAPDTTAPAVQYIGMPTPAPIPIRDSPTVPTVPHDVPRASDTSEQKTTAPARKICAERVGQPDQMSAGTAPTTAARRPDGQ